MALPPENGVVKLFGVAFLDDFSPLIVAIGADVVTQV
jgi:hypothetical protein